MKRCRNCGSRIQIEAHHCQHCNSNLIGIDGEDLGSENGIERILVRVVHILLPIFLSFPFYITGLLGTQWMLGSWVAAMETAVSIILNLMLFLGALALAFYVSPKIISWVRSNYEKI